DHTYRAKRSTPFLLPSNEPHGVADGIIRCFSLCTILGLVCRKCPHFGRTKSVSVRRAMCTCAGRAVRSGLFLFGPGPRKRSRSGSGKSEGMRTLWCSRTFGASHFRGLPFTSCFAKQSNERSLIAQ